MLVFMFPGQSSAYPGMLDRILETWPDGLAVVDRASSIVGRNLLMHYRSGNEDALASNEDIQIGVFLTSYLYQQALTAHGVVADLSLGLSLGEYNHLVHIGAIEFEDALRLVATRGRLYEAGPDGMMASVFPLSEDEVSGYLETAQPLGEVVCSNLNSPSQTVISGSRRAVEEVMRLIEDDEAGVRTVVIEPRLPMHAPCFAPVAAALRPHLRSAPWRTPNLPYIPNVGVDGGLLAAPGPGEIAELLTRHVYSPVRWRDCMEAIIDRDPNARFVEVGPGRVLCNLMQRRWLKNEKHPIDHDDAYARLEALTRDVAEYA